MRTQRNLGLLAMALMVVGGLVLVPVGEVRGQLQDHNACGNPPPPTQDPEDPDTAPAITCGRECGLGECDLENGEKVACFKCEDAPISTPGWPVCNSTFNSQTGQSTCDIDGAQMSCQVA